MKFATATPALIALGGFSVNAFAIIDGPQTCNANPECAARQLADDCCPTNPISGIFLACCDQPEPSCAANAGCSGLDGDCCPSADGVFLYCCLEPDPDVAGYKYDYTYYANGRGTNVGEYWMSTGEFPVRAAPGHSHVGFTRYKRSKTEKYDLIYVRGTVADAGAYVKGDKGFSIMIMKGGTTAPPCTQVMLQFENEGVSQPNNYPTGRHSRYLGTISPDGERLEFDFVDRPDEALPDSDVDSVSLLFAPGTNSGDTFDFYSLNSYTKCRGGEGCQPSPTKSCPAVHMTVEDADEGPDQQQVASAVVPGREGEQQNATSAQQAEQELECSDCTNPACMGVGDACSVVTSYMALAPDPSFVRATESGGHRVGSLLGIAAASLYTLSLALFGL